MGFTINTNISAMNAHTNAMTNNREIDKSLSKLSSGLRINTAADDASGLSIADSLRTQASSLGQAISNANDGISIIQIADKAMDEQTKILDTIKTKATQAAQDGQSGDSRKALQADISRLMEELDNIAGTTSFNGQTLLSGQFTNKEFQVGAYSNQSIKASIGATSSDKIGSARFETTDTVSTSGSVSMKFVGIGPGSTDITLESVKISTSAGTGLGALAETINKNSNLLGGIQASFNVQSNGASAVAVGTITDLHINGVNLGTIKVDDANDSKGVLVNAINQRSTETGVTASTNQEGKLVLTSNDGRGIKISGTGLNTVTGLGADAKENYGRLTLTRVGAADIIVSAGTTATGNLTAGLNKFEATMNLRDTKNEVTAADARALGFVANANAYEEGKNQTAGVTTLKGAMAVMKIADAALKGLDAVRSDLGSVQNQLTSTINNIAVTQVNVKSAESQIRDVDFASESANFSKHNILAQSGSYAMSQANAVQQNVLKLLQ